MQHGCRTGSTYSIATAADRNVVPKPKWYDKASPIHTTSSESERQRLLPLNHIISGLLPSSVCCVNSRIFGILTIGVIMCLSCKIVLYTVMLSAVDAISGSCSPCWKCANVVVNTLFLLLRIIFKVITFLNVKCYIIVFTFSAVKSVLWTRGENRKWI